MSSLLAMTEFVPVPARPPRSPLQEIADVVSLLRRLRDERLAHPALSDQTKIWVDSYYTPKIIALEHAMASLPPAPSAIVGQ